MRSVLSLARRNCLCYFRDRASVVFSLMAALIVLLLYLLFLRDMLISSYPSYPGMDHLVDVWVLSGLMGIVAVTTCAGALSTLVSDRADARDADILVTPMGPLRMTAGYILSTFVVGLSMSLLILVLALVYLNATGCPLDAVDVLCAVGLTVPSALSGCVIMYAVTSLLRSQGAFSGMFTVVSVLIGFLTGIYMPMGSMPSAMQVVGTLLPATQLASLFRQTLADDALQNVMGGAGPSVIAEFRTEMGFDLHLGDLVFTPAMSLSYTFVVTMVFLIIAVVMIRRR
ncbi:MAG: ABC transporter permease [archaeon]|nr:ABC transporter permease [archaeon]